MKLTSLAIRKQQFKKSMRGYDTVEVDTFLELIADEFDALVSENATLNKKLVALETELRHFKEVEKTLKDTLYNVQETSQISKENSLKEAELVKKEAELAATQMIDRAREEVRGLNEEFKLLRQQKESFISRLRHLLASQIELLDVLEVDDEEIAKLKNRGKSVFFGSKKRAKKPSTPPVIEMPGAEQSTPPPPKAEPAPASKQNNTDEVKNKNYFNDIFNQQMDVDGLGEEEDSL